MRKYGWAIILGIVLLLAGALAVGMVFFGIPIKIQDLKVAKQETSMKSEKLKKKEIIIFSPEGSFITNVKDSRRYLKASIAVELENDEQLKFLNMNIYKFRDIVIAILRSQREEDVYNDKIQLLLKGEIGNELREKLQLSGWFEIFFSEFVIQ